MLTKIIPFTHWDANRGPVALTHADVDISRFQLGQPVRGTINLGFEEPVSADPGAAMRFKQIVGGNRDLTPDQLAVWKPSDPQQFAFFIIANAGLAPLPQDPATPASPPAPAPAASQTG